MSIDTKQLLNELSKAKDIHNFLNDYEKEFLNISPTEFLNEVLARKSMSLAEVSKNSGLGEYVYKVFRGERKPSRDVILAIAVGLQMSVDETQLLLRVSKLAALDPRNKRDSVILYSIKEEHDISHINDLLYELNEQTL